MDTTGTFEMAAELGRHQMLTCIHKHYTAEDWDTFLSKNDETRNYMGISAGVGDDDFQLLRVVLDKHEIPFLCLDVANGTFSRQNSVPTTVFCHQCRPCRLF